MKAFTFKVICLVVGGRLTTLTLRGGLAIAI